MHSMHPDSTHTAPNTKRTGNVNSDVACHSTMCPDADHHGICLPDGVWQSIFLLDALFQGIFLLDAAVSGQIVCRRCVSWQHSHTGCQGTECCSKYLGRIRKHPVGSKNSDSVQFYSLYLQYIHLYMLLPHFAFPAQAPSVTHIAVIITSSNTVLTNVVLLYVLETKESWQIRQDTMRMTTMRRMAMMMLAAWMIASRTW